MVSIQEDVIIRYRIYVWNRAPLHIQVMKQVDQNVEVILFAYRYHRPSILIHKNVFSKSSCSFELVPFCKYNKNRMNCQHDNHVMIMATGFCLFFPITISQYMLLVFCSTAIVNFTDCYSPYQKELYIESDHQN